MESFADLWGRMRTNLPKGRVRDERAELVHYFETEINISRGKRPKLPSRYFGIRLSHYKDISDLYLIQSEYKDRLHRQGRETADKWWWWVTATKNHETDAA